MKHLNQAFILLIIVCFSLTKSFAQSCIQCNTSDPLNSGLVACYPFAGNVNDETGLNGAGTVSGATLSTDRFGIANSAYTFGTSKIITTPTAILTNNNYTFSVWVKLTSLPTSGNAYSILSIGNNGALGDQALMVGNNYSPNLSGFVAASYRVPVTVDGADRTSSGILPTIGVWYNAVMVRDSTNNKLRLYINGSKVGEQALSSTVAGYSTPILGVIGGRVPGNFQYFNGSIDDVRIYNKVLTDTEIAQLYALTNFLILPPIADKSICSGDSVQLTATGGTAYSWSPATGLSNAAIANPIAKPASTQQYIVTVSNGTCTIMDTVMVFVNTNCCATCSSPDPLNTGLLACYPFDANVKDASGNNRNGTANNITYTTDRFGSANNAISLNGISSSVDITNTAFQLPQYTYSLWVNVPSVSAAVRSALSIGTDAMDQALLLSSSNGFGAASYNTDLTSINGVGTGSSPSLNTWHHMVIVRNSTTLSLFMNGSLVASASVGGKTSGYGTTGYSAQIGRRSGSVAQQFFLGKIDDVRIYNRALSNAEILQLYTLAGLQLANPLTGKTICAGDSVQLTTTGGTTYLWSPATGLSNPTIQNPFAKPTSATQYSVNITNGRCSVTDTVLIKVDSIVKIAVGPEVNICLGDSIQLQASGAASYLWTPATGLTSDTIANPIAFPIKTTDFIVKGSSGVCPSKQDTIRVSVCVCSKTSIFDTILVQIPVYDTILVFDSILVQHHVYDTTVVMHHSYDTIPIYDTIKVFHHAYDTVIVHRTVYDTIRISVTDTLFIDILSGLPPSSILGTIKVYPNPAHDFVLIDNGNYALLSTYSIKIMNTLGQMVYGHAINQQTFNLSTTSLGGAGTYFIQILNASNQIVEIRKLIIR